MHNMGDQTQDRIVTALSAEIPCPTGRVKGDKQFRVAWLQQRCRQYSQN